MALADQAKGEEFAGGFVREGAGGASEWSFPGRLLLDEFGAVYRAWGLPRSVWRSLVTGSVKGLARFGIGNAGDAACIGCCNSHLVGDSWQLGGVFVVERGRELYAFREEWPGQELPDEQHLLRDLLRLPAEVNMDARAALESLKEREAARPRRRRARIALLLFFALAVAAGVAVALALAL